METTSYHLELTLLTDLLGTVPKNTDIYAQYIASRTPENTKDELDTVPDEMAGWTGFHILDGQPILYDYVIKGFFKDAAGVLRRVTGSQSSKLKAYKKIIDGLVFVTPRQIPLVLPTGASLGTIERPLRAQTAQGERVALARSDTAPAGTRLVFDLTILGQDVTEDTLREWLDYGAKRGLGQWRNAGWGTFTYTLSQDGARLRPA